MEVGSPLIRSTALPHAVVRLAAPRFAIAAIVGLSSLVQLLLAWRRPTPGYFPDEYMYAELGRSLLESGSPLVRGGGGFLPVLYPLLTAPMWLWDSVDHAYRSIQAFNSVAMSLTAIPVFLLARRLGVGERLALAAAALAVALPELLYSSTVLAEPVAYPLALAATAAAVAAVERPLLRLQAAAIGFAGLASFTRLQLAVIPLCYLVAVVAVGLRERELRRSLRTHWLGCGATMLTLAAVVAAGLSGRLGLYGDLATYRIDGVVAAKALGANALLLAYSAGWVIVPGALIGLALAVVSPRRRAEHAFGVFALALIALLLVQTAVVGDVGNVQERYAIYALPLLLCLFALYASRGWPHLGAHVLLAAVLATTAAAVPLAGYAAGGASGQSLVLVSLRQLESVLGDVGLASLVFAAGATGLSALALGLRRLRPKLATPVALGLTALVAATLTTAAVAHYQTPREALRAAYLPADPSWVDAATDEPVTLLVAPRSARADVHTTLFWNRSISRVALLDDADRPDAFAAPAANVDGGGRLDLPAGPLLVDEHGSSVMLRDANAIAAAPTKTLWLPERTPQLQLLLVGRYYSGLLAAEGGIRIWPREPGGRLALWLELDLSAPGVQAVPFSVELPGGRTIERTVGKAAERVRIPVCGRGVWTAGYASGTVGIVHGTRVGLRSSEPRLVDDAAACS